MRDQQKTTFARHLRRNLTDAERLVWHHLRNRALAGAKFRRQHPIGPYIVDFACIEAHVIVELDGGQHGREAPDRYRTAALEARGWRVLRFWTHEVFLHRTDVLAVIHGAIEAATSAASRRAPDRHDARHSPAPSRA